MMPGVSDTVRHLLLPPLLVSVLAGCNLSSGKPSGLPTGAVLVAEGFSPLSYEAPTDGRVYVWDSADHRVVYEADLRRGQSIWLDVQSGWVLVDHKPIKDSAGRPVQVGSYVYHWLFFQTKAGESVISEVKAGFTEKGPWE